jgi:hypothetical protein
MEVQMSNVELKRIAKFITDLNKFTNENADIFGDGAMDLSFDYFDSNGDQLGVVKFCDWGEFGFVPAKEIED